MRRGLRWRRRCRTGAASISLVYVHRIFSTNLLPVNRIHIRHIVDLLPELAVGVFVIGLCFASKEGGLQTQPIGSVSALLRHEVHLKSSLLEGLIRVMGFADEETGRVAIVEGGGSGGDCNNGATWERHLVDIYRWMY